MISLKKQDSDAVDRAVDIIMSGGVIIYPTDTIYGFGVDAKNDVAIKKLNRIKNRQDPISVLTDSVATAVSWAENNDDVKLITQELTGLVTLIYKIKERIVSTKILGEDHSLGVRFPDHPFCLALAKTCSTVITTTSVNRHGKQPLNNPHSIKNEFNDEVDLLIDGGDLSGKRGSYIYKIKDGNLITIR